MSEQEKDTESKGKTSAVSSKPFGVFNNVHEATTHVKSKTEKISGALYLITNLFSDSEPIKWTLRASGLALSAASLELLREEELRRRQGARSVVRSLVEITSELEIAFTARIISQMNYSIVRDECLKLAKHVETNFISGEKKDSVLDLDFFKSDDSGIQFPHSIFPGGESLRLRDTKLVPTAFRQNRGMDKGHNESGSYRTSSPKNYALTHADSYGKKTERQNVIMDLLRKESHLTIKDFSKVIKDRSEKTIQRELLEMVAKGVLKKEGERRWTKYSLSAN